MPDPSVTDVPASRSGGYLRRRLVALTLALVVPYVALEALELVRERRAALAVLAQRAADAQAVVEAQLARGEGLLSQLSRHAPAGFESPAHCAALIGGLAAIDAAYADIVFVDAFDRYVCSSSGQSPPAEIAPSAEAGATEGAFALGGPLARAGEGDPVAWLAVPVRRPDATVQGTLALGLDLAHLSASLPVAGLPAGATVAVADGDGRYLLRAPPAGAGIGQPVPRGIAAEDGHAPGGVTVGADEAGVQHVRAVRPLRYGLRVVVEAPAASIRGMARGGLADGWVADGWLDLGALTLIGLLAAFVAARHLAAPLQDLARTARRLAAGGEGLRADEGLPGEFGEVARDINRLVALHELAAANLRWSERRALRLSRFYEALSSTNQAIVRAPRPAALYEEVCRICVATRLADMAWIGVVEKRRVRPVAWGARAREYTEGLDIDLDDPQQQGPTAQAVRSGRPVTANRYLADPSTQPWRARAARFDVRASAAFPFRCQGEVVGTLNLYVDAEDYFDAEMVELLQAMTHDISLRLDTQWQEDAGRAQREAEAANRAKTLFLSKVSHELRTPLNAILGFARLLRLRSAGRLDAQAVGQLDYILLAGTQLEALIEDVLDVSRIEAGQLALDIRVVAVEDLVVDVVTLCEPMSAGACVTVRAPASHATPTRIASDPVRLRQVLLNLLTNGIKYNRPGGSVTVRVVPREEDVLIHVEDTGVGMSQAQLAGLFQPFNRLGRERSPVEGTGIGLNLSRQLVALLGGELEIRSREAEGTQASLRLPRGDLPAAARAEATSLAVDPMQLLDGAAPCRGRVLYIEDNLVNAVLMEHLLSGWPQVEVTTVGTGGQGLAEVRRRRPDLILLDMDLPDLGGLEVLARLKADEATRDVRVVVLSASARAEDRLAALRAGASDYWTKPIEFVPVLRGIEAALRAARAEA